MYRIKIGLAANNDSDLAKEMAKQLAKVNARATKNNNREVVYLFGDRRRKEKYKGGKLVAVTLWKGKTKYSLYAPLKEVYKSIDTSRVAPSELMRLPKTKTILGYVCHQVIKKEDLHTGLKSPIFWVTDALPQIPIERPYRALKGGALALELTGRGLHIVKKARQIEQVEVKKSLFEVPEGYTVIDE